MNKTDDTTHPTAWIAAGVQHAVLSRTMPALRHDLAGSVSVLRMGLAVITRKLESGGEHIERDAIAQRTQSLAAGITHLNDGLRRLRHWDKPTHELLDARELLGEIWELARPFLALRNIDQPSLPNADDGGWPKQPLKPQPLMYLLLASIYHLAEGAGHTPERIIATPLGDRIRVSCEGRAPAASVEEHMHDACLINTPPIDQRSLQCLANHLQSRVEFKSAQSVLIHLD